MPELDPFETRLARAVGAFADRAITSVDAAEVARVAAGPERAAGGLRTGRGTSVAWLLLLAGLFLALVVGTLMAGARRPDHAVVVAPSATPSPTPAATPWGTPAPLDSMTHGRVNHTATLLEDGRVLLTGGDIGEATGPASAEVYDPATGAFTPTWPMHTELRAHHSAIRLADGRVLVIGGSFPLEIQYPEIWDPVTRLFWMAGGITVTNWSLAAGPLPDRRVLVIWVTHLGRPGTGAELYDPVLLDDPAAGAAVSPTGSLAAARSDDATATLLGDGRVLLTGGGPTALEVYDPETGQFSTTGSLSFPSAGHAAALLADGRVLIVGGASAAIYDPTKGLVSSTGSMATPRTHFTATLLAGGRVLVAGGDALGSASAELYDPATGRFSPTGSMAVARARHTATLLRDGTVLIAGGMDPAGGAGYVSAELYDPETGRFSPVGGR